MKKFLQRAIQRRGYRIQNINVLPLYERQPEYRRNLELQDVLARRMLENGPALAFIQVGAFDGITADPLYPFIGRHKWTGVMVEPQPTAAAKLRALYRGNPGITVLENAVDRERGARTLYTVDTATTPEWAGGMASFDRNSVTKHSYVIPDIVPMIREITVSCITFDDVLRVRPFASLDVLQVDAEGADALILSLFPFERLRPAIVHWEIKNLTHPERELCLRRLAGYGYTFAPSGDEDMLAVLPF